MQPNSLRHLQDGKTKVKLMLRILEKKSCRVGSETNFKVVSWSRSEKNHSGSTARPPDIAVHSRHLPQLPRYLRSVRHQCCVLFRLVYLRRHEIIRAAGEKSCRVLAFSDYLGKGGALTIRSQRSEYSCFESSRSGPFVLWND